MKIKTGVNFHNRFDIVKNGEWIGYAENIILNQMYNRICNLDSYFKNIHFGTGTGTPTPERTSLFSHLGTKAAVTEETIKAMPTSKWTRKITLNPEEYVGSELTEVGIAYGSSPSDLVTHAMIKDAEGNPLSISKTSLDVVEIYATVFITFVSDVNLIHFIDARTNPLIQYFLGGSVSTCNEISVGISDISGEPFKSMGFFTERIDGTRVVDVAERKIVVSGRFGIDQGNRYNRITEATLSLFGGENNGCVRVILNDNEISPARNLSNVNLGVGDGVTTKYTVPNVLFENIIVKIDGVPVSGFSAHPSRADVPLPLVELLDLSEFPVGDLYKLCWGGYVDLNQEFDEDNAPVMKLKEPTNFYGKYLGLIICAYGYHGTLTCKASVDGLEWDTIASCYKYGHRTGPLIAETPVTSEVEYNFIKMYHNFTGRGGRCPFMVESLDRSANYIEFDTPPQEGAVITADYMVPYIPKDENHVLDLEFTLQFGEGTII